MNEFSSYQDSLNQYQDTSTRTESDEQLEKQIEESSPDLSSPTMEVEMDKDGNPEEVYRSRSEGLEANQERIDAKPPEPSASEQIESARDEDREFQKGIFTEAIDYLGEKLLGRSPEESQAMREEGRQRNEAIQQDIDRADESNTAGYIDEEGNYVPLVATTGKGIIRDSIRTVTSGVDKAVQDTIGFGNFAGDFAKTKLGLVEEDDVWNNTDHKDYVGSERDLVMSEPRSQVGQVARDLASFVVMQRQLGAATGLNKVAAGKGFLNPKRLGAEAALGAVADFMMDPGDGNASNALIKVFPSLKNNPAIAVFAHADDDDEFTRRLKNTMEGGVMSVAVDAAGTALKGLFKGVEPLLNFMRENPGAKAADAPAEVKEQAFEILQNGIYHGTHSKDRIIKEGFKPSSGEYHPLGEGVYFSSNPELAQKYGPGVLSGEIGDLKIAELSIEDLKQYGVDVTAETQNPSALREALGDEFDGVRVKGLYDSDPDLEEVVIFDTAKADSVVAPRSEITAPEGSRPGYEARMAEDIENGGTKSRQDYEPYERAELTTETPISKVIDEQRVDEASSPFTYSDASPRITDNTIKQLNEAGADMDIIEKGVKELQDDIGPRLTAKDPAVVEQAVEQLRKFHVDNTGEDIDLKALTEMVAEDGLDSPFIRTLLGDRVAKATIRDISKSISNLAGQAREITETGMDANKQFNILFDRLKAVTTLQIREGSRRGSALQAMKGAIGLGGNSEQAIAKRVKTMTEQIDGLQTRLNDGDPEALADAKVFTDALALSDGNPEMAQSFTQNFFKYGRENFETSMYNAYLSGLNTQQRNFLGNGMNVLFKPLQMAMGSLGQPKQARAALAMYGSMWQDLGEGYKIAKTSWVNNTADTLSKVEGGGTASGRTRDGIQNLIDRAKNPAQAGAARLLMAQYNFMAAPWTQGATRMLDSADRGFRVLSARQKVKYDQMLLNLNDGLGFNQKAYDVALSSKIKGDEIVDEELFKWARTDTFQEALDNKSAMLAEMINVTPFLKYVIPFIKTPVNIIKQGGNYVPLAGRIHTSKWNPLAEVFFKEYTAVMRGSDESAKAIYRGREGFGTVMAVTFGTLGFNGISTGYGPRDPKLREVWLLNNRPHSIKIGDVWVSNRFLGPLGILMSAYSDIGELAANRGSYDSVQELSAQLVYATAGSLLDQSWMKAAFEGMSSLHDVAMGKEIKNPDEWVANIGRAMVPYQAALRSWNNTLTPGLRDYNSAFEKLAAETIPFAKSFLGAERTSMFTGEPVANGGLSALNQATPFSLAEIRDDEVIAQMIDLGVNVPMEFTDKYKGVNLTVQEDKRLNEIVAKNGLRQDVKDFFESDWFKQSYEAWESAEPPIPREKAEWMIEAKSIFLDHRNDAVAEYRDEGTTEADQFDRKIQAIEDRDFFGRTGNYYGASKAQQFINEVL